MYINYVNNVNNLNNLTNGIVIYSIDNNNLC